MATSSPTHHQLPLAGIGVLVTREVSRASRLIEGLRQRGATVFHHPVMTIEAVDGADAIKAAFAGSGVAALLYAQSGGSLFAHPPEAGVAWTSANAVSHGLSQMPEATQEALREGGLWSVAVGKATARALQEHGITPIHTAPKAHAAALAEWLCARPDIAETHILFPCSARARRVLPERLEAAGAVVSMIPVYQPVAADFPAGDVLEAIAEGRLQLLTFTSPSTVEFFLNQLGDAGISTLRTQATLVWAAIGETTAAAIAAAGFVPSIIAAPPGIPGMLDAIEAYYAAMH